MKVMFVRWLKLGVAHSFIDTYVEAKKKNDNVYVVEYDAGIESSEDGDYVPSTSDFGDIDEFFSDLSNEEHIEVIRNKKKGTCRLRRRRRTS